MNGRLLTTLALALCLALPAPARAEEDASAEPPLSGVRLTDIGQAFRPSKSGRSYAWFLQYADAETVAKSLAEAFKDEVNGSHIRIQASKAGNAVLVSLKGDEGRAAYRSSVDLMRELDARVGQVLIEVLIADVSLERGDSRGFNWRYVGSNLGGRDGLFAVTEIDHSYILEDADIEAERLALKGGKIAIEKTDRMRGFIHGLLTRNRFNVISSPKIVATNNREAIVSIGEDVPIVSGSELNENGRLTYTYKDFSAKMELKVTPRIGRGDTIILEVSQSIDELGEYDETNKVITKTKRELTTSLVVDDRQTAVLGGFITRKKGKAGERIPYLSDLPLVGRLFSQRDKSEDKSELMIFITPKVIASAEDAADATESVRRRLDDPGRLDAAFAERARTAPPLPEGERVILPRGSTGWFLASGGKGIGDLLYRPVERADVARLVPARPEGGLPAPFGYGPVAMDCLVYATKLPEKKPCYGFRRRFDVPDPSALASWKLSVASDSAAFVYVNGVLVDLDPDVNSGSGHDANYWNRALDDLDPALLKPGANEVVALLRNEKGSKEAYFDLEIATVDAKTGHSAATTTLRHAAAGSAVAPSPVKAPAAPPAAAAAAEDEAFARVKARWLGAKERR